MKPTLLFATILLALPQLVAGCGEGTRTAGVTARRTNARLCRSGQTLCSGSCVSLDSNASHCGSCSNACFSGSACVQGICTTTDGIIASTDVDKHDVYDGGRGQGFNRGWRFYLGDVPGAEAEVFDDSSWRSLNLPHDYSIERPFDPNSPAGRGGGYLDGGVAWYRKTFTVPESYAGRRLVIHFDGVYMDSHVWLNGKLLGNRPYGYSSFGFDLTDFVHFGQPGNVIAVQVNNQQPSSRWYSGSGIYRNVWLAALHPVHVADSGVFIHFGGFTKGSNTPALPDAATASVSTEVINQSEEPQLVAVTTTIRDKEGSVVVTETTSAGKIAPGATETIHQSLTVASPQLWSPDTPYLYRTEVEVVSGGVSVDVFRTTTGIRYLHFDPNRGLFLNGQPTKLFGAALHDDLGALGTAFNARAMQRRVELLKAMGANAIRTAHNPPAPELLKICDELGMLVMDEAFDCWESAKSEYDYARFFADWAQIDVRDMVRRDRNHPSVVMWSAGNEIADPTLATAAALKGWILEQDATRPVTWARDSMENSNLQQIADQVFDLAGFNYPSPSLYDTLHATYPAWACFGSEVMSGRMSRGVYVFPAQQRNLKTFPDWGSSYDNCTSRQAMGHDADFQVYEDRPYVFGRFIWSGFDYLGEMDWPLKSNNDGKVDTAGFPKDAYYIYQSRLTAAPMVHLLPHWNWKAGGSYQYTELNTGWEVVPLQTAEIPASFPVTVMAYTNCDEVELFLNGVSLGTEHCRPGESLRCQWEVPWEPGTLRAVAKIAGQAVASTEVATAGEPAAIGLTSDRERLVSDDEDLIFVTADIRDNKNTLVPTANNRVSFSVSGPGEIIAVDNGDPSDTDESYQATARRAFAGKCLAILRATGEGSITVSASSEGLLSNSVSVTSHAKQ